MVYTVLLTAHIAGGVATGIVASYAGIALWQGMNASYRKCALVLSALAVFEVVSGTVLALLSVQLTAQALCTNIGLYLAGVSLVETLLFIRMKKVSLVFPVGRTLMPVAASLVFLVAAVSYGL